MTIKELDPRENFEVSFSIVGDCYERLRLNSLNSQRRTYDPVKTSRMELSENFVDGF